MFNRKRVYLPLILLAIISIGTCGFMTIEGWSFLDSLYMTIITLTTIGYSEVHTISQNGQIFNIFLIIIGVGTATFSFSTIVTEIASVDFEKIRRGKMIKKIRDMEGHTIVCGFGRMGEVICKRLSEYGTKFVVIEKRANLIEELKKNNFLYVEGDAANDDHLIEAGIKRAKVLVSVIDNDSDGLYVALASRSMKKDLFIIVRANEEKAKKRMLRAGADRVILPFVMSGHKVAETVINPSTEDLFDITNDDEESRESRIQLADLFVNKSSKLNGQSLEQMGPSLDNLIIIGIKDKEDKFIFKPKSDYRFKEGDCLIAMGPLKDYEAAKTELFLS